MFRQNLTELSIFQGFSEQQLILLDSKMSYCTLPPRMIVFEQGEKASHFYILTSGEVTIHYKPYDGPPLVVARILPGGVFGWSAALGHLSYTSTARVKQKSEAYRIQGEELRRLCETCPEVGSIFLERLAVVISERLHNAHSEIKAILAKAVNGNSNIFGRKI
jgi:CRP/FNR family cyclic AMP-dependent transcriptional regulator